MSEEQIWLPSAEERVFCAYRSHNERFQHLRVEGMKLIERLPELTLADGFKPFELFYRSMLHEDGGALMVFDFPPMYGSRPEQYGRAYVANSGEEIDALAAQYS